MADRNPETIILLNGTASSGKMSLAKAIQRLFDEPYLLVGINLFWERPCFRLLLVRGLSLV